MKQHRIHIKDNVDETTRKIVSDYWSIENGEFKFNLDNLFKKYSLKQNKITQLIKENSYCLVEEICEQCQTSFERKVETKGNFKSSSFISILCLNCINEQEKIRQENERIRVENYNKRIDELRIEKEKKRQQAIDNKRWLDLNDFELEILEKIIECIDLRSIKKVVFCGNFYDKTIWRAVNRLESFGLIHIERNDRNNSVTNIEFDTNLKNYIKRPIITKFEDYLSFSLTKKDNKTNIKQPDYSGTFTLLTDVVLKAGVKYIYGGWVQTDNSINLKFTPLSEIVTAKQTDIENESKIAKDILSDMLSIITFDSKLRNDELE